MMDTVVTVTVYGGEKDELDKALELCRSYEKMLSRTENGSDIELLNQNGRAEVNKETAELILLSEEISNASDGAFDITLTPLTLLWDVKNNTEPPSETSITAAMDKCGHQKLSVNGCTVDTGGTMLDLGGIAKGYIADKVAKALKNGGVKNAVIDLGGNLVLIGDGEREFTVGIQKPFAAVGEKAATVKLKGGNTSTSGIYERYFEYDGKIYHHIIDAKTGCPVENEIASVTVIADTSAVSDALSTACLVLGTEGSKDILRQYNANAVFILRSGEVVLSENLTYDRDGNIKVK